MLQLQRTTCSVPMSKAIMLQLENRKVHQTQVCSKNDMGPYGCPWFPVFFQTILQFLYVFLPKLIYFAHDFKGSAQDAMLTPPGHVTKIAQHSRQNAYRSTKRQRQDCTCNISNTTVNAIKHPVLDTIGGIPNRIPLASTTSFNHPKMAVVG